MADSTINNSKSGKKEVYGLARVQEWLHYCGRCNSCKFLYRDYSPSCPAFEKFQWESYTSSGKVWMARDLYEEKFPLSESIRDRIFSCTLCGNCTVQCQQEVSNHALDIFEALREECVENGYIAAEHKAFADNIDKVNNPYAEPVDKRFDGISEKYFKPNAEVYLFVGCTTAYRNPTLFKDILKVLDAAGVDFTLSKDEVCCGSPLLTTGQTKAAKILAEKNIDTIKNIGAKTVITACAGCFRTLKAQYTDKFPDLTEAKDYNEKNIEVLHISQYINKILSKKLFDKPSDKIRVTFHDPCHMGRHIGVYEEPRKALKKIKNVELVEMPRNRQNSWCCGAGAGVKSGYKDWAVEIAEDRVKEAMDLNLDGKGNIEYLVTTCPFCERNLGDAVDSLIGKEVEKAADIEVIDLIQLLAKYLKEPES